jgi:DNA-binding transcriptional ArsR family regulator
LSGVDDVQLDQIFKALADPIRRRIMERLREQPNHSLFQMCAVAVTKGEKAISRLAISPHLDMLEKAELVHGSWSGRTKIHPLRKAADIWLHRHLQEGKDNRWTVDDLVLGISSDAMSNLRDPTRRDRIGRRKAARRDTPPQETGMFPRWPEAFAPPQSALR